MRTPSKDLAERIEARIERIPFSSCWHWVGKLQSGGYASLWMNGKDKSVHRLILPLYGRTIPDGYEVDHLCRNRSCVNPAHLEPVTRRENVLRGMSRAGVNGRKTHCKRGHPLVEGNIHWARNHTRRHCRECHCQRKKLEYLLSKSAG